MEKAIPTKKVFNATKTDYIIINEADFNPDEHEEAPEDFQPVFVAGIDASQMEALDPIEDARRSSVVIPDGWAKQAAPLVKALAEEINGKPAATKEAAQKAIDAELDRRDAKEAAKAQG